MSSDKITGEKTVLKGSGMPAGTKLFAEDGWIFAQAPGKGVQCLHRIDEASLMAMQESREISAN